MGVGRSTTIYTTERPGDIRHSYADPRKVVSAAGISFTSLEEGLARALKVMGIALT